MSTESAGAPGSAAPASGAAPRAGSLQGQRTRRREGTPPAARPQGRGVGAKRPPRRKRKVRKVHRVVRHIEVWSVLKLSVVLAVCGYVVAMASGYLLWRAADRVGTIDGIEGFFEDAGGYDRFEILGDVVFRSSAIIGLLLAFFTVFASTLGAVLFNLISDLTGGIRMTVIDEDLIVAPARRPRPRPAPEVDASPPAASNAPARPADETGATGPAPATGPSPAIAPSRDDEPEATSSRPVAGSHGSHTVDWSATGEGPDADRASSSV